MPTVVSVANPLNELQEGDIVNFVDRAGEKHPALVLKIRHRESGDVSLLVWDDQGESTFYETSPYEAVDSFKHQAARPYTWHFRPNR